MNKYLKVYGFLKEPLDKVVLIVCSNYDYFHGKGHVHLRYIVFGKGIILDEPNEATVRNVFDAYKNLPVIVVHGPCPLCISKGIIGPSGHGMPESYSDPEEDDED